MGVFFKNKLKVFYETSRIYNRESNIRRPVMGKNSKSDGEKGQAIAIGELAKYDIDVCLPMSDNLAFDFITVYNGKLFRTQVKSGKKLPSRTNGSIEFDMRSNNWHKKTSKTYTSEEIDVMILCDYNTIYLLEKEEWEGKSTFTIRTEKPKNNQTKGCNLAEDYVICNERLAKVFC